MWRMDCVDVDTHAWRHTLTHACPLAASSKEDGPVVRRGTMLFGPKSGPRGNQKVWSVLATPGEQREAPQGKARVERGHEGARPPPRLA